MRRSCLFVAAVAIAALPACQARADSTAPAPKPRLTEAQALKIAMSSLETWDTENAKALDTMYTPNAIGFDASTPPFLGNGAAFVAINQPFKAMNFDKVSVPIQKIQVLSDDIFVFTTVSNLASTNGPGKPVTYRCTDVWQRQPDNKFLVINEHCSFPPKQ